MHELGPENTVAYLHASGRLAPELDAQVEALAWGVSNVVLRVTPAIGEAFVIKQSRVKLRTRDPWFSRLDRIWREAEVMQVLAPLLPEGVVPHVLFEDRDNYLFAMEAAPAAHMVWKQLLLEGQADPEIASRLGTCLAALHRETANRRDLRDRFADTEVFVQLRVDPFYRRVAAVWPEIRPHVDQLIDEMFATKISLVHADFSPKNVLIAGDRLILVDYETGHYGDPAFDLGFFLSHLLLKSIRHADRFDEYARLTTAFRAAYQDGMLSLAGLPGFAPAAIHRRTIAHLAGCMWARIDGTSPIDYLNNEAGRGHVREFCRGLFVSPPENWPETVSRLRTMFAT